MFYWHYFNIHFQDSSFSSPLLRYNNRYGNHRFQYPFSGFFLFFTFKVLLLNLLSIHFNIHFQDSSFSSPFGKKDYKPKKEISISIFRILPFLRLLLLSGRLWLRLLFQYPFSGFFLFFHATPSTGSFKVIVFQYPFSGFFLFFVV